MEHIPAGPPGRLAPGKLAPLSRLGGYLGERWRRDAPDVVHAQFWTCGIAALAGARGLGVPVLQTFGSLGTAERRHRLPGQVPAARIRVEASISHRATVMLASSSEEVSELTGLGVPRSMVRVVPCGIDTTRFSLHGQVAPRGRRPRLLAAGSLAGWQDLDKIMYALAGVPQAELVIIGGPPRGELAAAEAYRRLDRLAARLEVRHRVTFTGQISVAGLPALFRSADLLVSIAPYEPIGTAALQAMACGTPVVASAVGSHLDTIVHGTTGVLVPPGRPELLARALRHLLADPQRIRAFGVAAADRASAPCSWDRIAGETLAAYENSMKRDAPSPDH
jgi:glycosyltransferase involved in cell wall biosynthesis